MILYSLSFIVIIIFVYETFKNYKIYQKIYQKKIASSEHMTESFDSLDYPSPASNVIGITDILNSEDYPPYQDCALDTTHYKAFAPLIYNPTRKLFFSRQHLEQEAVRQDDITQQQIAKVQALSDKETNPDKKKLYDYELGFHKWRAYPFQQLDNLGNQRLQEDITTDYVPSVFGQQRVWQEIHWHTTPK